jgi:putative transport protein
MKIKPDDEMKKFRMAKINLEEPLIHKKMRVTNPEYFGKSINDVIKNWL